MTNQELLTTYRATVIEIEELEVQLEKATPTGRPAGCRSAQPGSGLGRTNDPMAAALQLCEGLETMIKSKRDALAKLNPPIFQLITSIANCRTLLIVQNYYLQARTDEQIGYMLGLSTTRVNQLRNKYFHSLDC